MSEIEQLRAELIKANASIKNLMEIGNKFVDERHQLRTENAELRRQVEALTNCRDLNSETICSIDRERTKLREQLSEAQKLNNEYLDEINGLRGDISKLEGE